MNGSSPENKDSLEELEKKLYRRSESADFEAYRSRLSKEKKEGQSLSFRRPDTHMQVATAPDSVKSSTTMGVKIFIAAAIFFIVALGIAGYLFLAGGNVVSADNIETTVEGPVSVRGGDPVTLSIQFTNNNRTELSFSNMTVEFPEGTRSAQNPTKELLRFDEAVGALKAGESVTRQVTAILYGGENVKKDIKISFFYKPVDSSSIFKKTTAYPVEISSSPVALSFVLPREVNAGRPLDIELQVVSNTKDSLRNVLVDVSYPPGFSYASSSLPPLVSNHIWSLGTLAPGKSATIRIVGSIEGQDDEQKAFRALVGTADSSGSSQVSVPYGSATRLLSIRRPFLGVTLVNGSGTGEVGALADGATLSGVFTVANNLQEEVQDFRAVLKLSGDAIVRSTVIASDGFFRSNQNQIEWNRSTSERIGSVLAGEVVELPFVFDTAAGIAIGKPVRNRQITLDLTVTGTRLVPGVGREDLTAHFEKVIPISSVLGFTQRALYSTGPFQNKGPMPPVAEQATQYTIVWTLSNSSNNMSGVTVSAKIPTYVAWQNQVSPGAERVVYDPEKREITWNIGALPAGVGYGAAGREVAFQIAVTPSLSQKNSEPVILEAATASGLDDFTNVQLTSIKRELTTNIATDPQFQTGQGSVR